MKNPIYLRQETWNWLLENGLLKNPELLQDTVIAQNPEDGPECLITKEAARSLVNGASEVKLLRLGDQKPVTMTKTELIRSLKNGQVVDQLDP